MSAITLTASNAVVIAHGLSAEDIDELREECTRCLQVFHLSNDELCSRSCAIDLFENSTITDQSLIRTDREAYLSERWRLTNPTAASRRVIEDIIFRKLPDLLKSNLGIENSYLFNEHYIIKPGGSDMEFDWHIDEEKQLGFLSPDETYVTLWCPLDDVTADNGTLVVNRSIELVQAPSRAIQCDRPIKRAKLMEAAQPIYSDTDGCGGLALEVDAGTLILFSSKLPHCSGPNRTQHLRRVFYAQYSPKPIGGSEMPLCYAVPTNQ